MRIRNIAVVPENRSFVGYVHATFGETHDASPDSIAAQHVPAMCVSHSAGLTMVRLFCQRRNPSRPGECPEIVTRVPAVVLRHASSIATHLEREVRPSEIG
jgi:hypothetical protein